VGFAQFAFLTAVSRPMVVKHGRWGSPVAVRLWRDKHRPLQGPRRLRMAFGWKNAIPARHTSRTTHTLCRSSSGVR